MKLLVELSDWLNEQIDPNYSDTRLDHVIVWSLIAAVMLTVTIICCFWNTTV